MSSFRTNGVRMECVSFLWIMFLVSLQGSSAVTDVFVKTGKDILLNVKEEFVLKKDDTFFWKFNQRNSILRFIPGTGKTIFDEYVGRVEFSEQNYSVKLKNLKAADSGVYEAHVSGAKERTLAEYNVTVQDPVTPVKLKVDFVSSSSDSCTVNVTCSTEDSDISGSFRCVNQTCDQVGGEQSKNTNSGASLRIYLSNVSIICNHSNHVSWTKNVTKIQDICKVPPVPPNPPIPIVTGTLIGIAAVMSVGGGVLVQRRKKRKSDDTENTENTIYATPQVETTRPQDESPTNDATCMSPTSTYSFVGPHTRPIETRSNAEPESQYATVEKPSRPCKNLQEL